MAGCKPEYLPVVLAAVEAVLDESFAMHGVLATTMFVGPVVIVNGPVRRRIGMNAKGNALGQGNRANSAIGRALQLVIRNVGEGRPQEVDRATLGNPGKLTYCFAEDEEGSSWEPLSVERGVVDPPRYGLGKRRVVLRVNGQPAIARQIAQHRRRQHASRAIALDDRHQPIARKVLRHRFTQCYPACENEPPIGSRQAPLGRAWGLPAKLAGVRFL